MAEMTKHVGLYGDKPCVVVSQRTIRRSQSKHLSNHDPIRRTIP